MDDGIYFYRKEELADKVIVAGGRADEFDDFKGYNGWDAQIRIQIFSIEDDTWNWGNINTVRWKIAGILLSFS